MTKQKAEKGTALALPVSVEILPPDSPKLRTRNEDLDRLVRQRVAEIVASREGFIFEPFFRSRQVAFEIKRLQTVPERKKWSVYFERHGCLSCHEENRGHAANGFCNGCYPRVSHELRQIVSELMKETLGRDPGPTVHQVRTPTEP